MNYIKPELARVLVERLTEPVPYENGARCPLCGGWGEMDNRNVKRIASGSIRRRYLRCPDCGLRFTADENMRYKHG